MNSPQVPTDQMASDPAGFSNYSANLADMQLFPGADVFPVPDGLAYDNVENPGFSDIGASQNQQPPSRNVFDEILEMAAFQVDIERTAADTVVEYFNPEVLTSIDPKAPSEAAQVKTEPNPSNTGRLFPDLTEEQLMKSLESSLFDDLGDPAPNESGQEPDAIEIDRLTPTGQYLDCPNGKLYRFVPEIKRDFYKTQPVHIAAVAFHLPSYSNIVVYKRDLFDGDHVIFEIVRNGAVELKSYFMAKTGNFVIPLSLIDPDDFNTVDTFSIYLQKDGKVVKPLLSFYNTTRVHQLNLDINLAGPVVKMMFEIDREVDPQSVKDVLDSIKQAIVWRRSTGNWHDKVPLVTGAWSYFQVSLQCFEVDFEAVSYALEMAILPLLSAPEAYPEITGFPIRLMFPHGFIEGPRLEGPLIIRRVQRGPVLHG